jgi:hypothetical protein
MACSGQSAAIACVKLGEFRQERGSDHFFALIFAERDDKSFGRLQTSETFIA